MSSEKDPYWQLKNGGGGMEGGGDSAPAATEGSEFPRKRVRSSGSYTDESINSAETSPKKAKVQIDSSFELSEKVQNNHQDNSTSDSDVKTASVPSENVTNTAKTNDELVKDTVSDQVLDQTKSNVLTTKSEEFHKKSVKQQVEELATEQGMEPDYRFLKPPGYKYKIGQRADPGDYNVCLSLTKDGTTEQEFCGEGSSPYEAIREASKRAREYFTSSNGNCLSPNKDQSREDCQKTSGDFTLGEEEVEDVHEDKVEEVNGTARGHRTNLENDSDVNSGDSDSNQDVEDEVQQEQPKWVHSLENFWDKALATKFPTISVNYADKEPEGGEEAVECSIGKLMVMGTGNTREIARENAAQFMFSLIENILESEGTETLKKNIIEGEDSEETEDGYTTVTQPPFKDETAVETGDEENYEDYDEDYEEETQQDKGARVVEEEIIDSSDDSQPATSPQKHPDPAQLAPAEQLLPGAEYCLALARVDRPDDRPMVMDVPNLARRTKARLASQLLTSLREGDLSDEEDHEGDRVLDLVQKLLSLSTTLSDRHKLKVSELFSRSGLGQASPSLPMPGMMAGMGYGQYHHQMFPQQAGYPGMPGYPGGYPSQKMRLLAGQAAPQGPPQPEPPKPVQPLKNLCQFPLPGAIEGVGSVTVTLEDYKTLQVGTFLNDVIIDFYMKYLQFTQFSHPDKNRVHIFTTFWFSRLTSKPSPIEARKDPVQRRYDRVKRWTRKVNIFEKDFVVVPINENYHWYLCIICYPGQVGCQAMEDSSSCTTPVRQRNRRRAKDKVKMLKSKMNAKPRKDESDERDEPLASEDEVEHEDDSTDVELWKTKLTVWEREEALRREEEERRRVEMERQRREWEERRREYEEQQRKLYEEQQRLMEEEELRLALEQEEMGDEEENWEEGDKYDEDGNPIEEKYDEYGELIIDKYDEFGEPVQYDEDSTMPSDQHCENGGFADAAKYISNSDKVAASEVVMPVKARAMAADWDDWGEEEEEEEEMESDTPKVVKKEADNVHEICYSSMVAHATEHYKSSVATSVANQLVTTNPMLAEEAVKEDEMDVDGKSEPEFVSSMVAHTVLWRNTPAVCETAALVHRIELDRAALENSEVRQDIPQVDGMVDEGSDEEQVEGAVEEKSEEGEEKKCVKVVNKRKSSDGKDENTKEDLITEAEVNSPKGENGSPDESSMSTDDEVTTKKVQGLVGYADTGDDTDTDVEKTDNVPMDFDNSEQLKIAKDNVAELPEKHYNVDKAEHKSEALEEVENSDIDMEGNSASSDTEDYEKEVDEKTIESNIDDRLSDSEIEELDVMEKEDNNKHHYNSEDPSDRSQSESEASDESDYEEDASGDIPVKQPCILVFDSLGGRKERQSRLCATLRDFLALEFAEKYPGQSREFSTRTMPGSAPKVPQQPNLTDCGLYLCQNVETFFRNPVEDFTLPITSLGSWFPESESRMKRSNVAGIIRKLATQQNQDKLEQLQLPDLLFVEPEKVKPSQRNDRRSSPGSDGDNMDDEYNSEDEYDDDEEQDKSERYSSSPNARKRGARLGKDDRFSSEDEDNSDNRDRSEEDRRRDRSEDDRRRDRSEDDRRRDRSEDDRRRESDKEKGARESEHGQEERRQKRYRSDDSRSEDERRSRHYKRRNDRASSSESDDDFDSSDVYGRPTSRPVPRPENNLNIDSSPMRKLPPGISISRTVEANHSRNVPQARESSPPEQPEITRRLPPGISISRTVNNPPPGLTISREKISPPAVRSTIISEEAGSEDPFNVTIEDVSDYSDDCEPFDLDEPAYMRTYLQPNIRAAKTGRDDGTVASTLARLPPGVSISRGAAKVIEDMSESEVGDSDGQEEDMEKNDSYSDMDNDTDDDDTAYDATAATSASMVAHQAAAATIETCSTSMAAHQVYQAQNLEDAPEETVPQVDGMDDLDSEDDTNDNSTPAEALPVHQEDSDASELANPPEVTNDVQEDGVSGIENNPSSREDDEFLQNAANNEEVNIDFDAEEETVDDVDNIDNQGLKEGEEISPADSELPEIHDGIKTGEEFKNDAFDDGSNLQNAEEIGDLDQGDSVNAQGIYLHAQDANLPTEEAMDTYDDSDMLAHGAEILDDSVDADNTGTEDLEEGAEVLDCSAEIIDDGEEEVDDEEILDDGAEVLDDSAEVYEGDDVLDNNQEEYDYDEGEDEDIYDEDSYSYGYSQPPVKRARMSSDAEVVLDSGDEEDTSVGIPAKPQQHTSSSIHSQILVQQQAMLMAQQAQMRASQQQTMMMAHQQSRQPSGLSQQPHTASPSSLQQTGRKRKLESSALCIKDGQVYFKPFTQLPQALLNRKSTKHSPDRNSHKPSPVHQNPSKHLHNLNPYKHSGMPGPSPYQPVLGVHQMAGQRYTQLASKQEPQQFSTGLHQRIRQLPPGIMVQRTAVREESRDSVEDDDEDDEYHSDDPEEVIDGQEVEEDLDIIEEHTNKDVYSEEEEEESCDEVQEDSDQGETHEDVDVQDESEEGETHEDVGVQEDSDEETHDNGDSKENDSEEFVTRSSAEVDVEFEEASVDVQEAREENDKIDVELEVKPSAENSEKQSDLIEGEEVANCDESQKDNDGEPTAASVPE